MTETIRSGRHNPCKGCPDRYTACSDHCKKPEYLAWKEEQARIREARRKYKPGAWQYPEASVKHKFGTRRKHN